MTSWWNKNAENRIDDFKTWVGDFDQPSKIYCRSYVAEKRYKSLLDCGCGLASDYYGFRGSNYEIEYTGLDSCKFFIDKNKENGIIMIDTELEETFPIPDNTYECVYCREVIEHLSYYEKTISEMIRVASKEVIIVWFIEPDGKEKINYWEEEDLYHNTYDKKKLEEFIAKNDKVSNIIWKHIEEPTNRKDIVSELAEDQIGAGEDPENIFVKISKPILHIILK